MMKRIMSFLLCLIMVLGLAAPSVQASGTGDVSGNIMDNIVIEDGANVDIVVDGNNVSTSQGTKLPNPADLVTKEELPYTFDSPVVEEPVVEECCECADLASAVEHSGICLVKAPYIEICEDSVAELFTQWGNYTLVEQTFLLSYLQEKFPLKHYELEKLLSAPIGSASETYVDGTTVSVEGIPQDGSLTVGEADAVKDIVDAYMAEQEEAVSPLFSYDVSVQDGEGADWQPDTNVKMELELPGEKLHKNTKVFVVHVDDNGVASTIEATVTEDGKIAFETPGFSAFYGFTVDFHYEDITFSIPGMSSIKLSELFEELKMPLNASDVVALDYTDDTQIKIEQLEGDWLLTSLKAFDTEEKLTMTMADGTVYEIKVTDYTVPAGAQTWHIYNGYHGTGVNHIHAPNGFSTSDSDILYMFNQWYSGWDQGEDVYPDTIGFETTGQTYTVTLRAGTQGGHPKSTVLYVDMVEQWRIKNGTNVTIQLDSSFDNTNVTEVVLRTSATEPGYALFYITNGSLTLKGREHTKLVLDCDSNYDGSADNTKYPIIWEDSGNSGDPRSLYFENVTFRYSDYGAIDLYRSVVSSLTLKNCTFESTVDSKSNGGAIRVRNSNMEMTKFEVTNCYFDGNEGQRGGAICVEKGAREFTVSNTQFTNCTARSVGAGIYFSAADGSSANAQLFNNSVVEISNCTFNNNMAHGVGGGVAVVDGTYPSISIENSTFESCKTTGYGGAIGLKTMTDGVGSFNVTGNVSITGCTFKKCIAGNLTPNAYQEGTDNVPVTWDHDGDPSTPELDELNGASGAGAIIIGGNIGGKIEIEGTASNPMLFEECLSWNNGGAIWLHNGLKVTGVTDATTNEFVAVSLRYLNINKCFARDAGTAVYLASCEIPMLKMRNCTIQSCGYFDLDDENFPDEILVFTTEWCSAPSTAYAEAWAKYPKIALYAATDYSGTFRTVGSTACVAHISDCEFKNNRSCSNGGGVYWNANQIVYSDPETKLNPVLTSSLTITNTPIHDNYTSGFGGGIFCEGNATIQSCEIYNNEAGLRGGGIAQNVYNNTSRQLGESGANEKTQMILEAVSGGEPVKVYNNTALDGGGISIVAALTDSYPHTVKDGTPEADKLKPVNWIFRKDFTYEVTFQLGGTHVYGNKAIRNGGGIYYDATYYKNRTDAPADGVSWEERQRQVDSYIKKVTIDDGLIYSNIAGYGAAKDDGSGYEADIYAVKVTDASTLKAGDHLIIAAKDHNYAMSTSGSSTSNHTRGQAVITKDDKVRVTFGQGTEVFTLKTSPSYSDAFGLVTSSDGNYLTSSASENKIQTSGTLNANSSWTFTINGTTGQATLVSKLANGRNKLCYDSATCCYANYTYDNNHVDFKPYGIFRLISNSADENVAELVTSTSDLKDGDKIIISTLANYRSMGKRSDSKTEYRHSVVVTALTTNKLTFGEDVQLVTLEDCPGASGSFALRLPDGRYLRAASYYTFKHETGIVGAGSFKITVDPSTGAASIVPGSPYSQNAVQYNAAEGRFSAYEAGTQSEVVLYRVEGVVGNGGGVYVNTNQVNTKDTIGANEKTGSSTVEITGGEIYKNKVYVGNGGGVYLTGVNALCTISGSTTTIGAQYLGVTSEGKANLSTDGGNTATNRRIVANYYVGGCGGGIAIFGGARIEMTGGYVVYNDADTAGGGIAVHGSSTMKLENGYVDHNESSMGGGISLNGSTGNSASTDPAVKYGMYFNGGYIRNNRVTPNADGIAYGGGICIAKSTMGLASGTVSGNKACSADGLSYANGQEGGGIAVCETSTMTVTGGRVIANTAHKGGGMVVRGGSTATVTGTLTYYTKVEADADAAKPDGQKLGIKEGDVNLTTSTGIIGQNRANYYGAGVYLVAGNNTLTMTGGCINGNRCDIDATTANAKGGAAYVDNGATFTLDGGHIDDNYAADGGGILADRGTVNIWTGYLWRNEARRNGGAIYSDYSIVDVQGGEFVANKALGTGTSDPGQGGAIFSWSHNADKKSDVTVSGGTFKENSAYKNGGAIYVGAPVACGTFNITGGTFTSNSAGQNGGAIYCQYTPLVIGDSTDTTGTQAGTFKENSCTLNGGAVYALSTDIDIYGGTVQDNVADGNGGGFAVLYSSLDISGGDIKSNDAVNGGGLWVTNENGTLDTASTVTITGGDVTENEASGHGGGIFIDGAGLADTTDTSNGVITFGACTSLTMNGGTVSDNIADGNGGGVYAGGRAKVAINGTSDSHGEISNNTANNGGGVYVASGATLTVDEGYIINNSAVQPTDVATLATAKGKNTALYGTGGGICVVGNEDPDWRATFILDETGDVAIYGNTATFAADDVFANGNKTKLDVPKVTQMHLAGYGFNPEGWVEDYPKDDNMYTTYGLNMISKYAASNAAAGTTPVLRYRNATASQRRFMLIKPEYVIGQTDAGASVNGVYANQNDAYVCMTLGIPTAVDDTVVIDYGGELAINAWQNDLFLRNEDDPTTTDINENDFYAPETNETYPVDKGTYLGYSFTIGTQNGDIKEYEGTCYLPITEGTYAKDAANRWSVVSNYGSVWTCKDGRFSYTPKGKSLDVVDSFFYVTAHNGYWYYAKMNIVPATTIYYEDNLGEWHRPWITYHTDAEHEQLATWTRVPENSSSVAGSQDEDRPGDAYMDGIDQDNVYGYDSNYATSTTFSNGTAMKVSVSRHALVDADNNGKCDKCNITYTHTFVGTGSLCGLCSNPQANHGTVAAHTCADKKYYDSYCDTCSKLLHHTKNARATFTFTGTGFDIISYCSASTGIVSVSVWEGTENIVMEDNPYTPEYDITTPAATFVADTEYQYSGTTGDLYQVPVIKADMTKAKRYNADWSWTEGNYYGYGTYTVEIYVAPGWLGSSTYNGCDFYLDAIRIYNPAGINGGTNQTISDAYKADGEGWPVYQELRNLVLSRYEADFEVEGGTDRINTEREGLFFIDGSETPSIADYASWGPNNEIYLRGTDDPSKPQGITFQLNGAKYAMSGLDIDRVHIGIRTLSDKGEVKICDGSDSSTAPLWTTINPSATDMYYDLTGLMDHYVTILNTGTADIAITNLKITHKEQPKTRGTLVTSDMETIRFALGVFTAEQLADPVVTPKYPALSFNGMVCYNVFFSAEDLGDLTADDLGLAVFNTYAPDGTVENAKEVHLGAEQIGDEYMIATNGVNAKYLGDTKFFRAFVKLSDGSYIYSKMVSYSAKDYAMNVLAQSDDVKLKQLVVAMLNYGAEAQKFFDYKTYDLMNKDLTADDQALLAGFDASSLNPVGKVDDSKIGVFANNGGFSARRPAISFNGAFEINYFMTPANAVDGDMTMYFWSEDTYNAVTELTAENADKAVVMTPENGTYTACSDEIFARHLDETVYVAAVYESDGVTYCTGVLAYSIAAYCQKPPAGVQDLATAAAIYGCAAKEFFGA